MFSFIHQRVLKKALEMLHQLSYGICKKLRTNLHNKNKSRTFAPAIRKNGIKV